MKTITSLKKELSEDELDYYRFYYEEAKEKEPLFSKKWPVLLAVGFALAGALWFALVYFVDRHLKNEEELSRMFGLEVLGVTEENRKYGGVDNWIRNVEHKNALRPVDGAYLRAYLGTLEFGKIALCLDSSDEVLSKLADELSKGNGQLIPAGDLTPDSAAPAVVSDSDVILLLTRVGKSKYSELYHVEELANRMKKKIIGAVVVR